MPCTGFPLVANLSVCLVTKWTLYTFYLKVAGFSEHTDYTPGAHVPQRGGRAHFCGSARFTTVTTITVGVAWRRAHLTEE